MAVTNEVAVFLQAVCILLAVVGSLFVVTELRARFHPSFLFFGVTLILLSILSSIDFYLFVADLTPKQLLYWVRIYNLVLLATPPFLLAYLMSYSKQMHPEWIRVFIVIGILFSMASFSEIFLRIEGGELVQTPLYTALNAIVVVLLSAVLVVKVAVPGLATSTKPERRVLVLHLLGILLLAAFGFVDVFNSFDPGRAFFPSFTSVGALFFGFAAALVFAQQFLNLVEDRRLAYQKLDVAYRDLERADSLKDVGQSTAMINHEIKNYTTAIGGYAELLLRKEELGERGKMMVERIATAARRLTDFSQEILDLSRAKVIGDRSVICLPGVIRGCIDKHFRDKREQFRLERFDDSIRIHADWGKMEQVFFNLFKNSFDAGAEEIRVEMRPAEGILLVVVEDNGEGCDEEQIGRLFEAFFTTKKGKLGTGLGTSIIKSIIEAHGGHISAYSKNLTESGERGLLFNITLPVFEEREEDRTDRPRVILLKEGLVGSELEGVLRAFSNVSLTPDIVHAVADLRPREFDPGAVSVVGVPDTVARVKEKHPGYSDLLVLSTHKSTLQVLDLAAGSRPTPFSEQFIISRFILSAQSCQ